MNNSGSYGMEHLVEWYVEMVQHDKEILGTGEDTKQTEIIWSLSRSGMFAFTSVGWSELAGSCHDLQKSYGCELW